MVVQSRTERGTPRAAKQPETVCLVAEHALRQSPYRALHTLTCVLQNGTLLIHGTLPSYYLKQLAQETVRQVQGIKRVQNLVRVG